MVIFLSAHKKGRNLNYFIEEDEEREQERERERERENNSHSQISIAEPCQNVLLYIDYSHVIEKKKKSREVKKRGGGQSFEDNYKNNCQSE